MGLTPQVPRWPAAALEDGVEKLTAACSACAMRVATTPGQFPFYLLSSHGLKQNT